MYVPLHSIAATVILAPKYIIKLLYELFSHVHRCKYLHPKKFENSVSKLIDRNIYRKIIVLFDLYLERGRTVESRKDKRRSASYAMGDLTQVEFKKI